jgi:hypothetical protein
MMQESDAVSSVYPTDRPAKHPNCLMITFYDYPAEHWLLLRYPA